jgi:hypothetical protein
LKTIVMGVVLPERNNLRNSASACDARDVDDHVKRERDRFADAAMRQADVGGQHAVRQPRQRLLRRVRVDRRQAAEMPRVQRLEQVNASAPRTSPSRMRSGDDGGWLQQIGDRDRQRLLLAERRLCLRASNQADWAL